MGQIERLIQSYDARVSLPWERNLAGPQCVWFPVYYKGEERRLRRRLEEFEISTKRAKHGWITIDLTDAFALWLADHDYREGYFENPMTSNMLRGRPVGLPIDSLNKVVAPGVIAPIGQGMIRSHGYPSLPDSEFRRAWSWCV